MEITVTIDERLRTVTEASIRRHLKLEDSEGISTFPTAEIFEQLALMGYVSNSDSITFQKGHFSPQWKFLIHTILHCLSPKKTAWDQFSINIATAIICLATNRTFNFSKLIFDGMVKNVESASKFLMYPRFIQIFLNKHKRLLQSHKKTYPAPTPTQKLFNYMRRTSKGYTGMDTALFPTILVQGQTLQDAGSTILIDSQNIPTDAPSPSQPPSTTPITNLKHHLQKSHPRHPYLLPHINPHHPCKPLMMQRRLLQCPMIHLSKGFNHLDVMRVTVKSTHARRRTTIVVSDDEEGLEDPSKQGRLIEEIDKDTSTMLVTPTKVSSQSDQSEDHLKVLSAAKVLVDAARKRRETAYITPYTRRKRMISTASGDISTAKEPINTAGVSKPISTADRVQDQDTSTPSPAATRDKGKAIMQESEPPKKVKKKVQVQLRVDEELAKKLFEEEPARLNAEQEAKFNAEQEQERIDFETTLKLQKEPYSVAEVRKNMCTYLMNQGGYKQHHFKGMSYEEIRPIFERVWDQNPSFVPMDSEDKEKESKKKARGSMKKTLARKRAGEKESDQSAKRQKMKDD
ncbi:hypothetical protein Tco_0710583, partial [Tanacetum coccineum]